MRKARTGGAAVIDGERLDGEPTGGERPGNRTQGDLRRRAGGVFVKGVVEDAFDACNGVRVRVAGQRLVAVKAIGTHVVEAMEMLGVAVGQQHAIDAVDLIAQSLSPEIWAGIDEN